MLKCGGKRLYNRDMNNKQTVFVSEYLKDFNASRAARDAGYSEKTAYSLGQRLLSRKDVSEAVAQQISERSTENIGELIGRNKKKKSTHVYLFQEDYLGLVKIGIASDPIKRMGEIQVACPQNITLVACINIQNAHDLEIELHTKYSNKHYRGEWFRLTEEDIRSIKTEWENLRQNEKPG